MTFTLRESLLYNLKNSKWTPIFLLYLKNISLIYNRPVKRLPKQRFSFLYNKSFTLYLLTVSKKRVFRNQ